MTPNELRAAVLNVKRWSRADQRAPNKPLMMAYALAKYLQGHEQLFSYEDEIDNDLQFLLQRFGPARKVYHPEYSFWRLINDGIWRLDNAEKCLPRKSNNDPPRSELIKHGVLGGFSNEAYLILKEDRQFTFELLNTLLNDNFPESIVYEISKILGLKSTLAQINKCDFEFKEKVLRAYDYKCAVCNFDGSLNGDFFALEVAHIKWKQFNGPSSVANGLLLCSLHRKALDKGVVTLEPDMRLKISSSLGGGDTVKKLFWEYDGKMINLPLKVEQSPLDEYLKWHSKNVFID